MSDNGEVRDEVVSIAEATGLTEDAVADYWEAKIDDVSISTMAAESDRTGYDVQTGVESVVEALTDDEDPLLEAMKSYYKPPDEEYVWAYSRGETVCVMAETNGICHTVAVKGALGKTKQQYRDVAKLTE